MSATSVDPWRQAPPLELVRHELGHALCALHFGAESVTISHDGLSWKSTPKWPFEPTEASVMASWLGGLVEPDYCSTDDRIVISSMPTELKNQVLEQLEEVFEKVRSIDNGKLLDMSIKMSSDGGIQIRRDY
jgi:hypothetical protein